MVSNVIINSVEEMPRHEMQRLVIPSKLLPFLRKNHRTRIRNSSWRRRARSRRVAMLAQLVHCLQCLVPGVTVLAGTAVNHP